jgi:hypothetical protein
MEKEPGHRAWLFSLAAPHKPALMVLPGSLPSYRAFKTGEEDS